MNAMKLLLIAGARPNFVKIAPLVKAIERHNQRAGTPIEYNIVHTGQHYDIEMSGIFFGDLDIPFPDINLEVGSASHAVQTANVMIRFEQICLREEPNWVVVVGDVNSTMACTLVAAKMDIKVAHVEAGLRSYDRTMPEEINRIVTDSLGDLLFTPSPDADENLKNEGVAKSKIKLVGNVMIDTLLSNLDKARTKQYHKELNLVEREFAYVTLHRPSNVDDQKILSTVMAYLNELSSQLPVVFPVHPRTKKMLKAFAIGNSNNGGFIAVEPIGYHDSICLAEHARFVLTDSGGLQEETGARYRRGAQWSLQDRQHPTPLGRQNS
jgi:UDP-N-acetylglucosamine 2-epimerase (non-hydrolysing)